MRRIINVARKFAFPLNFLRIRHEDNKHFYLVFPGAAALVLVMIDSFVIRVAMIELINGFQSLLGILAGFYIASLAAVATFNKPSMDEKMLGTAPILPEGRFGVKETVELTRREYLCLLFGYLASASIVIYLITVVIGSTVDAVVGSMAISGSVYEGARSAFMFIYSLAVFNLLSVTLLGVYFLSHGIHRDTYKVRRTEQGRDEGG